MLAINNYLLREPNWDATIEYNRAWRTGILTTAKGTEQRSTLFTWPRRSLQLTIQFYSEAESNRVKRKLYRNLHNIWGIPFWQDGTALSAQAAAGQNVLNVGSTTNRNFEVGAPCIIIGSETSYEEGEIATIGAASITLVDQLGSTWPADTMVYPLLQCRIEPTQELGLQTSAVSELSLSAVEEFDAGITRSIGDASDYDSFNSKYVFNAEPNWKDGLRQSFNHPYSMLQFLGLGYSHSTYQDTDIYLYGDFDLLSKSAIQSVMDFFDGMRGQAQNFYFPSWRRDVVVNAEFSAGATVLNIDSIEYGSHWDQYSTGRYLFIKFPDNTEVCRAIVGYSSSTITLDSAIGKTCTTTELPHLLVSFLYLGRFAQDELRLRFITDEIAQTTFSCKTTATLLAALSTTSTTMTTSSTASTTTTNLLTTTSSTTTTITSSSTTTTMPSSWSATFEPATTYDDFRHNSNNVFSISGDLSAGELVGVTSEFGVRLISTIPQGATILEAYFTVRCSGTFANDPLQMDLKFNDIDNAVAPTNSAEFLGLALGTATVWQPPVDWIAGQDYQSPSLVTALQAIVDRAGYTSGNAIQLLCKINGSTGTNNAKNIYSIETQGVLHPQLYVSWGL